MKKFSLFENIDENLLKINQISDAIKITLGPTGKNGILLTAKDEIKLLSTGGLVLKSLDFEDRNSNVLVKLLEQAALRTSTVSGDGTTTTILLICELIKNSLKLILNGYNGIFLSNGLKKIASFLMEKIIEFSNPITNQTQLSGILKTAIGRKLSPDLIQCLIASVSNVNRDGLILIEENISTENEIENIEGIEIDKGFASSYFVNEVNSFLVKYDNPYILISHQPINSIEQLRTIIEFIKSTNKPLVIVAEEINKEILSTLVLNNIQKKFKIVVVKYSSIKFIKNGLLEDLALLTHANYYVPTTKNEESKPLTVEDLGQCEKVIINKEKSTFILSKFSKVLAKRKINELNRELLTSDSDYEKGIFKKRIARLSGHMTKIKIGLSNQYEITEQRQKVENAMNTLKSALEEGILPGGGSIFLYLREEISNWSTMNLIGDEVLAATIVNRSLAHPFKQLFNNLNLSSTRILSQITQKGYPYTYDVLTQKMVNGFETGLVDSSKSIRAILWNSLTIVSTLITAE